MRSRRPVQGAGIAVAAVLSSIIGATPAAAQGLLESIFGVFAPKPQPKIFMPSRPNGGSQNRVNPFDGRRQQPIYSSGGRYKTMCVRLCDGFYFPISSAARRREFYRDAEQCQAQCDSETRLFYMSRDSGSIESARDQTGLYYEELRNAFLYRKKLDKSCSCRPEPWSVAERQRHEGYALTEAGQVEPGEGPAEKNEGAEAVNGDENRQLVSTEEGNLPARPVAPSRAAVERRYVAVPAAPKPPPAFGLGALFGGGGSLPASAKPFKHKFRWPGDDGN
jgi:hypothetical protein